jgi:hypothetical protein
MPTAPQKSTPEKIPLVLRTIGFTLMLVSWWILALEVPYRNLYKIIIEGRGGLSQFPNISVFAFKFSEQMVTFHRLHGIIGIIILVAAYFILSRRVDSWDIWGRWIYKFSFGVLYFILYGLFLVMFIGVELPLTAARNIQ